MEYEGGNYYFCSNDCHAKFMAEPQKYADTEANVDLQSVESERKEDKATVKDAVCGMDIEPDAASAQMEYQGETYYFCSSACLDKFMAEPQKHASPIVSPR